MRTLYEAPFYNQTMIQLPMNKFLLAVALSAATFRASAGPTIDPIANVNIPAGKSLIVPVTATSPNGRPLVFTVTSNTNRIAVEIHTNNPFWKMSVAQVAASNAPGAYSTPFRGGAATVTNLGDMTFMLFKDIAPHTVDVISGLTFGGFYNSNTIFHRIVPGAVIQGGDPNTNGYGGPVVRYDDEFHPRALFSGNGQLALANSGLDTDGSQFFVTLGPQRRLDLSYTLFGQLLRGFSVLSNIFNVAIDSGARPLADVIITRASLVPNTTDTVLTLTGTNLAGVVATIQVVADDGAGGRATNSFTATTISDSANDAHPILYPPTVTNLVGAANARITNVLAVLDLENNTPVWWTVVFADATGANATNTTFDSSTGELIVIPNAGYSGPVRIYSDIAANPLASPWDQQVYTFAVGDTAISAFGTDFVARPLVGFTNQLLATFTNGVPNSAVTNFTAFINWGDNSTNSGVILTNTGGRKEVRGTHTYTNAGSYPVYIIHQSWLGAEATVVCTALVPPSLSLTQTSTGSVVRWPAWATDYQLQSHTNLGATDWTAVTNPPTLQGYESVLTNTANVSNLFFRLKR